MSNNKLQWVRVMLFVAILFFKSNPILSQTMFASFHVGTEHSLVPGAIQDRPSIVNLQVGVFANEDLFLKGGINTALKWFSRYHSYIELEGGLAYKIYTDNVLTDIFLTGNIILASSSYIYEDVGNDSYIMFSPGFLFAFQLNEHLFFEVPLYYYRGQSNSGALSGLRLFTGIRFEF